MNQQGKLYVECAEEIKENLKKINDYKRDTEKQSVHTQDWHDENSLELSETPDYNKTFPEHSMAYSPGAEFIPETYPDNPYVVDWKHDTLDEIALKAHTGDIVIRKDAFDVFTGNPHAKKIVDKYRISVRTPYCTKNWYPIKNIAFSILGL